MKILVVSNLYPPDVLGGYEIACAQAVDGLRRRGHDVAVLTSRPSRFVDDDPAHVRRELRLTPEWSDALMPHDPVAYRLREAESRVVNADNVHRLTECLREFEPDVVYLHNLVGLGGLGLVGCLHYLGVPWVWHLGDAVPRDLCSTLDGVVPGLAAGFAGVVSGTFIVVSRRTFDENQTHGLALRDRVEFLPYWIGGARPPGRQTGFVRDGHLRVISVGRVDAQKGADVLIDAAGLLRDSGVEAFSVDFYGRVTGPGFAERVRALGLERHVRLMGPRPPAEVVRLYGEYDLCAFPTQRREPFGIVPLEAAARGCVPLISADCGVAEWLVHGVHCLKATRDARAFAEVFGRVQRGEIDLGPVAARGAEAVWRDFHVDAVLPRIETCLRDAARHPGAAGGPPAEAYRLARLAERVTQALIEESLAV